MKHYVGLDVSMKETSICIVDEVGKIAYEGNEESDPKLLAEHLKKQNLALEKVALESGSISNWLVAELVKLDIPAICVDARQMAAVLSTQLNKNDKNDAKGIAQALRCNYYREVKVRSHEMVCIKSVLVARKSLVKQKTTLKNTVRGLLKSIGARLAQGKDKSFSNRAKAAAAINTDLARSVEGLLKVIETMEFEICKLEERLKEIAANDPDIKLLTTTPGVGLITALSFKLSVGDPTRFKDSRSVAAYLGLTPKQYASGEINRQGRISKYGDKETRSLLVEAATVMLTRTRAWSKVKAWGLKLMKKKGMRKATVGTGRKLAVIMHRMLITRKEFTYGDLEKEPKGA